MSGTHVHLWWISEVEFSEAGTVRRLECVCGAIDYEAST